MNSIYAITPMVDMVILEDQGVTFITGGYTPKGIFEPQQKFVEGLNPNALNLDYMRQAGMEVIDNRRAFPILPPTQMPTQLRV